MARREFSKVTPEQRAEYGKKGGIASGEARRRKKQMKETIDILLSMALKSGKFADIESIKSFADLKGKNINTQEAMIISILQRAMRGDVKAAEWIRDTAGQKPDNKLNVDCAIPVVISGGDELEE